MEFQVNLLTAGICDVGEDQWKTSSYRINRIHLPLRGRALYRTSGGVRELRVGNVYLLINGFTQDFSKLPGEAYEHLYLDFQAVPPLCGQAVTELDPSADPLLGALLAAARELILLGTTPITRKEAVFADLERLLQVLLNRLQQTAGIDAASNGKLEAAVRYINEHYAEPIGNREIAAALGVDERCLLRLFSRYMAMSPYRYLTQCRVDRAAELLREGRGVSETADCCGYQSEVAFRMAFKRVMGCTPSSLRPCGDALRKSNHQKEK